MIEGAIQKKVMLDDERAPGRKRLWFKGPMTDILDYLSKGLNFTFVFARPPNALFGSRHANGSWSGMLGMVAREEADISVGPFSVSASRMEVVDFTWPMEINYLRILAGRGRPEVDPWGFLLPLSPMVWAAILTMLLALPATVFLLKTCVFQTISGTTSWMAKAYDFIRIILQQDVSLCSAWWWERVLLAVWMLMTLVLTRSYAGNLMSLLAVRHIAEPYQTLRDVVDETSTSVIWQKESEIEQYFRSVKSGILKEVADMEQDARVSRKKSYEYLRSIDTLVRRGDHVLVVHEGFLNILLGQHFSLTGRCDFYRLKEKFLPILLSAVVPKNSPLQQPLSKRIMSLTEAGLYNYILNSAIPNFTSCQSPPSRISVSTTLSLTNLWGIFVVLVGGLIISLVILALEILSFQFIQ
ncbi:Glutamate receptor 2-like 6 [Homarus americanus]|uniref:Glutamate receptor 2-like 6 n=1 Tax=Homarus americanus TaxID=6706 RepID=A0A8J5JTU4_HOMAM|nr:Glutamate receptor 2-like 6 [Homarus americanus]